MRKNTVILIIACMLPTAVAAETQPVAKWVAPWASDSAPANAPADAAASTSAKPAAPFPVAGEKRFFPLNRATFRPAGALPKQPPVEQKATHAQALPLPPAVHAKAEPVVFTTETSPDKTIHELFDAE